MVNGKKRRFLWFFLPAWLMLTCIFAGVFTMDIVESERAESQAALGRMRNLEHFVRVELKALVSNGLLLRAQPDLQRFLFNRDPHALESLAKSILAFCQSKPGFLEVAFLDNQGRELLKVRSRNGLQGIAPAQALGRHDLDPRFAAIDGLAARELMVFSRWRRPAPDSGLDEDCIIELVIPVTDGQGRRQGALTASYAGEDFFLGLEDEPSAAGGGYLLAGPGGRCLFSSYPGPRPGQPLVELWPRLERAETGDFGVGGAQYVFTAIRPMLEGLRHSTGEAEALLTSATAKRLMDEEQWRLVVRQPLESWPASWRGPLRNHLPWYLALSLALGILGRNWTVRLANREEAFRQRRLAQERSRIGSAFEHAAIGTAIVSMDYRLLAVNRYLCQTLGRAREELVGQGLGSHLAADDYRVLLNGMAKALDEDTPDFRCELAMLPAGGNKRWALVSVSVSRDEGGSPLHFIVHVLDITENKRIAAEKEIMEAELLRAQKLEAIGILAGGIAHDFNNILGIICANAELVSHDSSVAHSLENSRRLGRLLRAGERGRDTVAQILSFCQPQDEERKNLCLGEAVADNLKLLEASIPKNISLESSLESRSLWVCSTQGEIQRIVTNLAVNASHAIGSQRGVIQVAVDRLEARAPLPVMDGQLEPGPWARLTVRDTGCGIDSEILEKVFDPFFTTKEKGKGTGLGLATIQRIVRELGGRIGVETSPGQGSAFFIYLPLVDPRVETNDSPGTTARAGQRGTLLIVDDEADYLETLREALEMHGYSVVATTDPLLAWSIFRSRPLGYCALISDNHMEGMSGTELARRVNQLHPELPIILCSGSYQDLVFDSQRQTGVYRIMRKPFTLVQLLETLGLALPDFRRQDERLAPPAA